jgi:antitoxin component of MazEF toxin-antitoxin module
MAQIRLRDRNQITLPAAITVAANLSADDALEVSFVNGVITLVPVASQHGHQSTNDFKFKENKRIEVVCIDELRKGRGDFGC